MRAWYRSRSPAGTAVNDTVASPCPAVAMTQPGTAGAVLSTLTRTGGDVAAAPPSPEARTRNVWSPSAAEVVSQMMVTGTELADPAGEPSTRSSTPLTGGLPSADSMATDSNPDTRRPSVGDVMVTVGAAGSTAGVTLTASDQADVLPRMSRLRTEKS